jgi:hypothetical protein
MYKLEHLEQLKYGAAHSEVCSKRCNDCKMCKKDTRDFDECWKNCDDCNRCHADTRNSQVYDEPYEYRNWIITPINTSFANQPYSKQYTGNVCGVRLANDYHKRVSDYNQCKVCKRKSMCYSPYYRKCISCDPSVQALSCEQRFGCKAGTYAYRAPIDPMFTNCVKCWNDNEYAI